MEGQVIPALLVTLTIRRRILAEKQSTNTPANIKRNIAIVAFDWIIDILAYSSGVLVLFMMLLIGADVLLRKFAGFNFQWSTEFTENAVSYVTFAAAAWLLKQDRHVNVDLLVTHLNPRTQNILKAATSSIGAAVCLFMAYRSFYSVVDLGRRNMTTVTVLQLPLAPLVAIIAVGLLLLSIQFMRNASGHLHKIRDTQKSSSKLA